MAPVPLLTFYGDDFTGSSAVMEVLSFAGVPTMLFLDTPDAALLAQFPDLKAVGVAGIARSRDPAWMRTHLPRVFTELRTMGASLCHYKVCSTFDSAPHVGSIGAAADVGAEVFDPDWIPLVVGAPAIGRFQVFGNLFAAAGEGIHRLDRHPVMAHHPVTPMAEADLARHLSAQTDLPVGIVDMVAMTSGRADAELNRVCAQGARIVALDVLDAETLCEAGRLIWQAAEGGLFAIGSQGVEYALVAHWRETGILTGTHDAPNMDPVDQLFAVSGSCAPTTATQIAYAGAAGFEVLDFDAATSVDPDRLATEKARVLTIALSHLSKGLDVLVTTARGPDDPAIARMSEALAKTGVTASVANDRLGHALGSLVAEVRRRTGLPRAAICGGDTSGHALSALQAEALSPVAPLATGAPLCRVHSRQAPEMDGLEVTLKGGQMGTPDFFVLAKTGAAPDRGSLQEDQKT